MNGPSRSAVLLAAVVSVITSVAPAAMPQATTGRNLLFRASGKQTSIYLLGSVHLLSKDYYPLNPALMTAFKDSDLLVEEVDMGQMLEPETQMRVLSRGMLPPGQSLDKVVSAATFELVNQKAAALALPIEPLKQFKPWSLAMMLMSLTWSQAGFEANLGLDKHFYELAASERKLVQGLETMEFQISRFDELTMPQQDKLLAETLRELDTATANVTKLVEAWKTGDVAAIEQLTMQDLPQEPEMYERLIVDRNRTWLPKIEALFNRPGRALVVVGAAHLVGPDGLLQMLKAKGYAIEQL